ncbi:MAG: hypothetical protein AAFZ15_25920, partial [Bacteroidota bacterium]
LLQVEYTDLRYNLDAKALLLRTYYDMDEEVAMLSLADAFRQYIKRNKEMTEYQKRGYYNLIKISRITYRLKSNIGFISQSRWNSGVEKLKDKIIKTDPIFNIVWLQEKIKELEALKR